MNPKTATAIRRLVTMAAFLLTLAAVSLLLWTTGPAQAQDGAPPVDNLHCIVRTDVVGFFWEEPAWSGGDAVSYDYQLTLPDGRREGGNLRDITSVIRWGAYQTGQAAQFSVTANYETPGGSRVTGEEATLTCWVGGKPAEETPTPPPNQAPTVSSAIADATIVHESGTHQVSLSGTFSDADNDALTVAAASSDEAIATVTVASDYSSLTVSAQARGSSTITVTADDGNGGTVSDAFTVTVKAAPVVASAIADVSGLEEGGSQEVSLSGVFRDPDGDTLTVTAASSNNGVARVSAALDGATLTVAAAAEGAATVTVTARDADGNTVSDAFDVSVAAPQPQQQEAKSSDATLNFLVLLRNGSISLRPAFSAQTAEYGATVPLGNSWATLRPTANHAGATITVDGKAVKSGASSEQFFLHINTPKRVVVVVTAEDGQTQRTYAVTATHAPVAELSGLSLSAGKLHPLFSGLQTGYRAVVPHGVDKITVTPTNRHDQGTITVNGQTVASGQASPAIALTEGENTITTTITAPDNFTSRRYTVTVTRASAAAAADATLKGLAVHRATSNQPDSANTVPYAEPAYTLTPAFAAGTYDYRVRLPERAPDAEGPFYVTAVATTNAPGAKSIVARGLRSNEEAREPKSEIVSGESSGPWMTFDGYGLITITVTSLDGQNTQTYRVILEQGSVDDPAGVALTPGDGSLTLTWGENTGANAPDLYWARWRKAGTTTWLNAATLATWKTAYGDDAPSGTAADGQRVTQGRHVITGLDNGTQYEVELRGTRGGWTAYNVTNWLQSRWITAQGTPGQPATALTITPSSPTREYGGTDDLAYTVSGLAAGDAAADVVTGALSRAAGNDVGTYAISMGTLAIASAYADKYTLPSAPSVVTYTITPKAITAVSGVTVTSRPADGATTATFDTSAATGTGVLAAELADFRAGGLQVSGSFPAATPGTHDLSVTYSLQNSGTFKAANYTLSTTTATLQGQLTEVAACGAGLMLGGDGVPAEGGSAITVTAMLSTPAGAGGATVTLTTGGTATINDDYTLSSTTVNIAAGATAGAATITVVDDTVDDDDETIILNAAARASSLTAAPLTLTIADNDDASTPAPTPVANAGCPAPAGGDYDADDDGLIEVCNLAQLNAIRWDLDGDGIPKYPDQDIVFNAPAYDAAFPGAVSGMGCPQTGCKGYELTADLDFDTNGNGRADAGDEHWTDGRGWRGIGVLDPFAAVFEGNGHVISNLDLFGTGYSGLFARTSGSAIIRNVGVEDVLLDRGLHHVGGLVGHNGGAIIHSYTTGSVSGEHGVGGLVGGTDDTSMIIGSYSTVTVTGSSDDVGGLVGGNEGTIVASYATGNVTGAGDSNDNYVPGNDEGSGHAIGGLVGLNYEGQKIIASYATGAVSGARGEKIGGLVGYNLGSVTASYSTGAVSGPRDASGLAYSDTTWVLGASAPSSYWDTTASGLTTSVQGAGKTTTELQAPTGYAGIYANWNVDLDNDGNADDPWDFGKSCQYPVLKYGGLNPADQRAPCTPAVAKVDYDADDDRLIEVSSLAQLNAIRWDLDGDGSSSVVGYAAAFPNAAAGMGCPTGGCAGYELTADLDFDTNRNGRADAGDAYWNDSRGWFPTDFGANDAETIFEGNGHTISNLYIHIYQRHQPNGVSLFGTVTRYGVVRNVGMLSVNNVSSHNSYVAGLVGINYGTIRNSYATGTVSGQNSVGGLVGALRAPGRIVDSYATASVSARTDDAGGLVGATEGGAIVSSYATGAVTATGNSAGGLLGQGSASGRVVASYATGNVSGNVSVGGLVGDDYGTIVASYATGEVSGRRQVGGLVGYTDGAVQASYSTGRPTGVAHVGGRVAGGLIRLSYWDTQTSGRSGVGAGKITTELQSPTGYTGIYANWNLDLDGDSSADDPWDFGNSCQYPVLKYGGLNPADQRAPRAPQQSGTTNRRPIVASDAGEFTIVNESGTAQISLSCVFYDPDGDSLTVTARSTSDAHATVSVSADYSALTVRAVQRGNVLIEATADDGRGGTVTETILVMVKAAPVVASAIADVTGLEVAATQDVSLSGVFTDADGDALTITAASDDETVATVSVAADYSKLTVAGVSEGTATITVVVEDADGNRALDTFDVPVAKKYTALIAQMYEWRNGPEAQQYGKPHTDRWDRALKAFGETVADPSITPMTAAEAQALADQDWGTRWVLVAAALWEIEAG